MQSLEEAKNPSPVAESRFPVGSSRAGWADEKQAHGRWPRAGARHRKVRRGDGAHGLESPTRYQHGRGALIRFVPPHSLQTERQGQIFERGERGEEIEGLEDHSKFFPPQAVCAGRHPARPTRHLQFDRA